LLQLALRCSGCRRFAGVVLQVRFLGVSLPRGALFPLGDGAQSWGGSPREVQCLRSWAVLERVLPSGGAFTVGSNKRSFGGTEAIRLERGLRGGAALAACSSRGVRSSFRGVRTAKPVRPPLARDVKSGRTERSSASRSGSRGTSSSERGPHDRTGRGWSSGCPRKEGSGRGLRADASARDFSGGFRVARGVSSSGRRAAEKLGRHLRPLGWWFLLSSAVALPGLGAV
jgi:hypothetical protein